MPRRSTREEVASLGEFSRIARFFAPLAGDPAALGLLDDAAILDLPAAESLVVTVDAIVEGVHFIGDEPPDLIARKLLRANLSDIAAMGASPYGYFLTTALPKTIDEAWLTAFSNGLAVDQREFGLTLLGGDSVSTPGPISLTATMIGMVPKHSAIRRNGAQLGDGIFVSGTIGDGALGLLAAMRQIETADSQDQGYLISRYRLPQPRRLLGPKLRGIAHAMLDVSDGLAADLAHIASTSGVAAIVNEADIPLSKPVRSLLARDVGLMELVLTGGDDYELLFTASLDDRHKLTAISHNLGISITEIGHVLAGSGVTILDPKGSRRELRRSGWRHF